MREKKNEKEFEEKVNEFIENMSLMDDYLMSRVFDENIPATQLLLETILNEEVKVVRTKGQWDIKNSLSKGRNIRLDVFAENSKGEYFDCEVQRDNKEAIPRRARFHSSMLDTRMLQENQKFKELKDSYVIFITDKDYFKQNEPLYIVERKYNSTNDFDDGSHIIYVNGEYDGDDDLGHLLSDFKRKDSSGFYNKELEDAVYHFKETKEGKAIMSESFKEFTERIAKEEYDFGREEGREEERTSSIRSIMKNFKVTAEEAMDKLDIPKNERSKYMAML